MKLIRLPRESNEAFLYRIYNDFGYTELKLAPSMIKNGKLYWAKHMMFKKIMGLEDWQWIPGTDWWIEDETKIPHKLLTKPLNKQQYFKNVTQRTIMDIEVMLDIDNTDHDVLEFKTIREKTEFTAYCLRKDKKDIAVYFTGNKSYHIGYIEPILRDMTRHQRTKHRESVLMQYFADLGLASELKTIALEGAIHYRSGTKKHRVII